MQSELHLPHVSSAEDLSGSIAEDVAIRIHKVDVVRGWPHTFWLKAPQLDRALQADIDMIKGLRWLLNIEGGGAE